jgi:hypothetical protein
MTEWITVYDSLRKRWISVHSSGKLYVLNKDLASWQTLSTTGPYPSASSQFVYDSVGDAIIGWSGSGQLVSDYPLLGEPGVTWRLKLAGPLVWEKLANAAAGDLVPGGRTMVGFMMLFDDSRGRLLLKNNRETWVYYPPK